MIHVRLLLLILALLCFVVAAFRYSPPRIELLAAGLALWLLAQIIVVP